MALCFFLAPLVFALDSPDPAGTENPGDMPDPLELVEPAEAEAPADFASPALPENPAGDQATEAEEPGGEATEAEEPGGEGPEAEELSGEGPDGTELPAFSADPEAAGEDLEALPPEDLDLEMTVYYDERTGTDYVEIRTPEKIEEYHYLSHIRYSDLIFVLSDLLRRITRDGYRWSSAPEISYEKNEEVALLYRKDLTNDTVYGVVQFPDFKVFLSAVRQPDGKHRFNAENGRDMMTLVFSFAACLSQAEQTLGIKQLDYTMRFFKPE
jgi:hypothetical protein